jgi:hypothetical protein
VDRDLFLARNRYIDRNSSGGNYDGNFLTVEAQRMAKPVNLEIPTMWGTIRDALYEKKPLEKMHEDPDRKIALRDILYAQDFTIITVESVAYGSYDLESKLFEDTDAFSKGWEPSLQVTDLDTGEVYSLIPGSSLYYWKKDGGGEKPGRIYIFPPFKTQHFSLSHTQPRIEYGFFAKIIGKLVVKKDADEAAEYADWNFPEVQVR